MEKILPTLIFIVTFGILLIGFNWGIPSDNRVKLIFGDASGLKAKLPEILETRAKIIKKKDGRLYNDDYIKDISYEDAINRAAYQFLLMPYAGDDTFVLRAIKNLNPKKFQFDPKVYLYGGGLIYTSAVFLQLSSWLGYFHLAPSEEYYMKNPNEAGKIYTVLRLMMVLFATLGICLSYLLANKYFGSKVAFLTWFTILSAPVTYQTTHGIEPHIFVLPFYIASFYFLFQALSKDIRNNYILSAIFTGIAIGTQATSLTILFPFFMTLILNLKNNRISKFDLMKYFSMYAVVALLSFLIINPYYILNYQGLLDQLSFGLIGQVYVGYMNRAPYQLSLFLVILFLFAILYNLIKYRNKPFNQLALAITISAIAVFIITEEAMSYVYSTIPFFAILSAIMLVDFFTLLKTKTLKLSITVMTLILFLIFPIARSTYFLLNFNSTNRDAAGEWINNNVQAGSTVAVTFPPTTWDCFAFKFYDYKISDFRKIVLFREKTFPDTIITVGQPLPKSIKNKYQLEKSFRSRSIFGYRFKIRGELHSLIARPINIYFLNRI